MESLYSESAYDELIQNLFCRFPSFQKAGASAYKPGIANMESADQLMGRPHRNYRIIHVAGTNGKGSVSNMLASVLASEGLEVGLYTSPHILDFRERIRVCHPERSEGSSFTLIPKESVWSFVNQWKETFDRLDLSFFEITTLMALDWFAKEKVDVVVLETGLGGRLDSTNIVAPVLSVITNIGLDHCDLLGESLPEIAFEKAGIIKPGVPVVVGESHPETDPVFKSKVESMSLLTFADKVEPMLWDRSDDILREMDLQGEYQRKNLRTVLAALDALPSDILFNQSVCRIEKALIHTAERTGFRGRWEKLSDDPYVICDIGHNEHGLKYNFSQLDKMLDDGRCTDLVILYGSVSDKDVDAVLRLMPGNAVYVFTQASSRRALPADVIDDRYRKVCAETGKSPAQTYVTGTVGAGLEMAFELAAEAKVHDSDARPLIYIGGSTYVVSEAVSLSLP